MNTLKQFKKESKHCWNCHIQSLILYVNVIQFYKLFMHWRVLIKSRRTEIIHIFCETAFSRYFTNINFHKWNIEQSYLVICPDLKLFITTQCGYVMKSFLKIFWPAGWTFFSSTTNQETYIDIIFLALIFTNKERQSYKD